MTAPRRLTLLVREGCHLCEEYEELLREHFGAQAFDITRADVDSRPEWQRRYDLKIPVLLDEQGLLLGGAPFDADALAESLGL